MEPRDCRALAQRIEASVAVQVSAHADSHNVPHLLSVSVGDNPATALYIKQKREAAERVGITFSEQTFSLPITTEEIVSWLRSHTDDAVILERPEGSDRTSTVNSPLGITGLWIQLPLPTSLDTHAILSAIPYGKDIDCLHPLNLGSLLFSDAPLLPATVRAVMAILKENQVDLVGKRVVVIGNSPTLGKPLATALSNAGATVTLAWKTETNLSQLLGMADVVVTATGVAGLVNASQLKAGVIVIDVGISKNDEGKIVGDFIDDAPEKEGWYTPVPRGVGPVTVACLMANAWDLFVRTKELN